MRRAWAGAAAGLLLVACGADATAAVQRAGGVTLLAAAERPDGVMDAQILGTLTVADSGCLALAAEGAVYALQFPFGSRLADDGESVEVPGRGTLRPGDEITGGGGYVDVPGAPEECRLGQDFAVWQTADG